MKKWKFFKRQTKQKILLGFSIIIIQNYEINEKKFWIGNQKHCRKISLISIFKFRKVETKMTIAKTSKKTFPINFCNRLYDTGWWCTYQKQQQQQQQNDHLLYYHKWYMMMKHDSIRFVVKLFNIIDFFLLVFLFFLDIPKQSYRVNLSGKMETISSINR